MQLLEVIGAVRPIYGSLGVKRLTIVQLGEAFVYAVSSTGDCDCAKRAPGLHHEISPPLPQVMFVIHTLKELEQ